jgi:hypothetical protein
MHKNATKYNKTQSKWCINKHIASKIIDTFETYHPSYRLPPQSDASMGAALSPPLTGGSYLDGGIDSPLRRTTAINATTPSTALPRYINTPSSPAIEHKP